MARKVRPTAEYVDEMLSGRVHMIYNDRWMLSPRISTGMAVTLFMAIKRIIVYNRIVNGRYPEAADGRQLQRRIAPDRPGYSADWLRASGPKEALELLVKSGLITNRTKNEPPYGYGCDQLYILTHLGLTLCREADSPEALRIGVKNVIEDKVLRGTTLKEEIDTDY